MTIQNNICPRNSRHVIFTLRRHLNDPPIQQFHPAIIKYTSACESKILANREAYFFGSR